MIEKNNNYRTDRPQDDIPEEIWIQNVLKGYRKEHEELESLRSYTKGLEEENVLLSKKLDEFIEVEGENRDIFEKNKLLIKELRRLKENIERDHKRRVFKLSVYKRTLLQQHGYLLQLEKLLDANGIEYHKMAKQLIVDIDSIDVTAVRKSGDLNKTKRLLEENE